ncbi:PPOX class F420-dependent oxidoreductase [Mumia sp. Pv 4-285]|uniref:PPOX class F420-dependent oxidoreductase n=1 Tax=Mumia qirimensis TaxID=3234852 RepID=UPI00351D40E1
MTELREIFAGSWRGVLVTLKRDGRPQMSNVGHLYDPEADAVLISTTADRAKVRNLRRDPRASFYATTDALAAYAVGEGDAELSAVAADPGDAAVEGLVAHYRAVRGEHPDWDEFRTAMVAERRLLVTVRFSHVYGWAGPVAASRVPGE